MDIVGTTRVVLVLLGRPYQHVGKTMLIWH